ncbi:MAG TPA: glycine cleavage system protein GcvH [Candidatus Marinimicrobia bacterium]|nr:glycine cleavage system protein GcvH [Candidatus Neomarinimicrobiota bacterium]
MNVPEDLKYTNDHEWVKVDGDTAIVGITDYAQSELGDIVYIELPEVGREVSKGDPAATIEAVKTVADVYSPLSGEVIEVNEKLKDATEIVNKDPYGDGWMFKIRIKDKDELNELLTAEDYKKLI